VVIAAPSAVPGPQLQLSCPAFMKVV